MNATRLSGKQSVFNKHVDQNNRVRIIFIAPASQGNYSFARAKKKYSISLV